MNAVFIHIPKTGGLAIEESLELWSLRNHHRIKNNFVIKGKKQEGCMSFGHMLYSKLVRMKYVTKEFDRSAFKFCFCRNPYDRAVSHWAYTMHKHPDIIAPGSSFLEFTRIIDRSEFRPQSWWLQGTTVNFIRRFENFEHDVRYVALLLGIELKKIKKKNSSKHGPYHQYYCKESKERVEKRYAVDFERFGYEKDNTLLYR
jgi:hypothetical protein